MIDLSSIDHIYIVAGYTDLRKAADGCSAIVQYDLEMNPFTKNLFMFCVDLFWQSKSITEKSNIKTTSEKR